MSWIQSCYRWSLRFRSARALSHQLHLANVTVNHGEPPWGHGGSVPVSHGQKPTPNARKSRHRPSRSLGLFWRSLSAPRPGRGSAGSARSARGLDHGGKCQRWSKNLLKPKGNKGNPTVGLEDGGTERLLFQIPQCWSEFGS